MRVREFGVLLNPYQRRRWAVSGGRVGETRSKGAEYSRHQLTKKGAYRNLDTQVHGSREEQERSERKQRTPRDRAS